MQMSNCGAFLILIWAALLEAGGDAGLSISRGFVKALAAASRAPARSVATARRAPAASGAGQPARGNNELLSCSEA